MRRIIRLREYASDFLTRRQGGRIRDRLVEVYDRMAPDDSLVIDFSGVDVMTPSFADECLGKLAERIGAKDFRKRVCLCHADGTVRKLINAILAERLPALEGDD